MLLFLFLLSHLIDLHSQENVLLQTILLSVKILFLCAANSSNIQSQYVHHKCSQALFLLLQSPNVTLRLITRALLSCLMPECDDSTHLVLRDDELTDILTSIESSLQVPLEMMKYLTNVAANASILLQRGILDLISPLADRLTSEEGQKILAELIWKLMLFESGSYSVEVASTIGCKELNQENSGTKLITFYNNVNLYMGRLNRRARGPHSESLEGHLPPPPM